MLVMLVVGLVAVGLAADVGVAMAGDAVGLGEVLIGSVEPETDGGDGPGIGPLLGGLVVLGAVFAMGLSAIRRQRAEGRRSKLPPIG